VFIKYKPKEKNTSDSEKSLGFILLNNNKGLDITNKKKNNEFFFVFFLKNSTIKMIDKQYENVQNITTV
jgi:hypothetical protein